MSILLFSDINATNSRFYRIDRELRPKKGTIESYRRGYLSKKSLLGNFPGVIDTIRLFVEIIPCHGVRPCSAAATNPYELTGTTLSFVILQIPEFCENWRILPDINKARFPQIAAFNLQITASLNLPDMGNERKANTRKAASRRF